MTTTNVNNYRKGGVSAEGMLIHPDVPCDNANAPFHQGDLVYYDATNHRATALDTNAHAANLLGVALEPSVANSNIDNVSTVQPASVQVGYGGIFQMKTVSGDTLHDGDAVYIAPGYDAQTITNNSASGSNKVGVIRLNSGQSPVVGGSGAVVGVYVHSKYYVNFGL